MSTPCPLLGLSLTGEDTDLFQVVIDTPQGSRNKYKLDEKTGCFRLNKQLPLGACFPYDFGFLPSTRGADGDPLDVLVLLAEPCFPGCVVPVRLLGVLEAQQTEKGQTVRNDRLIAELETSYNPPQHRALQELSRSFLAELEHFFVSYNAMEGREFVVLGRHGPGRAKEIVEKGSRHFRESPTSAP